jgi:hypothetical protein
MSENHCPLVPAEVLGCSLRVFIEGVHWGRFWPNRCILSISKTFSLAEASCFFQKLSSLLLILLSYSSPEFGTHLEGNSVLYDCPFLSLPWKLDPTESWILNHWVCNFYLSSSWDCKKPCPWTSSLPGTFACTFSLLFHTKNQQIP